MFSRPQQHVPETTAHTYNAAATFYIQPVLSTRASECLNDITGSQFTNQPTMGKSQPSTLNGYSHHKPFWCHEQSATS